MYEIFHFGVISEKFFTTSVYTTFTDFAKSDALYKNALDKVQTDCRMLEEFKYIYIYILRLTKCQEYNPRNFTGNIKKDNVSQNADTPYVISLKIKK